MTGPEIKILVLSNIFSRMMYFRNKGDVECGHKHTFDHATQVSHGSVLVEVLDDDNIVTASKVFNAPNMIFIDKDKFHRITALEDKTVCSCIHAIKTNDNEIIDPDFLIEPLSLSINGEELFGMVKDKYEKNMIPFVQGRVL